MAVAPEQDVRQLERLLVNASWLHRLRWVAIAGQLLTITMVSLVFEIQLQLEPLLLIIAFTAATNLGFAAWITAHRQRTNPPTQGFRMLGVLMLLDLTSLTGLLYFAGGPTNPFTVFYFVNLALSAVVLPSKWSWGITVFAVACCGVIFVYHHPVPELETNVGPIKAVTLHRTGLLVALASCAMVVTYFITRVTGEIRQQDRELKAAAEHQARTEKLESLATLAAGAGHELASPLSTIAVVTNELTHLLDGLEVSESVIRDVQLIRSEVDHCRTILDRMAGHAGQAVGEEVTTETVQSLLDEVLSVVHQADRVEIIADQAVLELSLTIPLHGFAQALRGILQNALDASSADTPVEIHAARDEHDLTLKFVDFGAGMPDDVLARAGEPFFTTKEPGKGMGLGLFLARSVVERLHGDLQIESVVDEKTVVTISLKLGV